MRRKFRRTLATVMAAALTVSLMGTADAEAAKKIKLSKKSITVTKGKSKTVTVKNVKAKKVKKLAVKSSKKKIATVKQSGKTKVKVTGKKAGSAKVTVSVTLKGKKKATKLTLKVKVKNAAKKTTPAAPTAAPATTAPAGQATNAPGGGQQPGGNPTDKPGDPTDKPETPTEKPGDPTKVPGTPTPNPWDGYEKPDPAANVTLKYNDNVKSEENPNGGKLEGPDKILFKDGEGYPEGGIDLMKYDRVIVKVAATAELTGDGSWFGKIGLNSSDSDYTGLGAYDDGMGAPKYMNDVPYDNGYVVTFAIPGDIDQETWSPEEISKYADAINMQLANADEYANLTVTEIAFESDKQPT